MYAIAQDESAVLMPNLSGIVIQGMETSPEMINQRVCCVGLLSDLNVDGLSLSLQPFLDQPVTENSLIAMQRVIADHYRLAYHPFTIVKIPEQDVTDHVLRLEVIESRIGTISVEGNRWVSSSRLLQYVKEKPGDLIDHKKLIQEVSFINRHPFRRVDLVFAPGKDEYTTDVIFATRDRRPWRFYSGVDNTGVDSTGEGRWYAGLNWGNAFGLDHILSYQYTAAFDLHLFQAHTLEYKAPLSWGHIFDLYGGYSEVHPHVHTGIKRNDGWSMQSSLRYTIPLRIYRYLEHAITVGGDFKRSNNTFEFTEDFPVFGNTVNLTQLVLTYNGNYERNSFRIDFDGSCYWSPGSWLADQSDAAYNSLRPGAVNHWFYFKSALAYLQRLPHAFSLFFLAEGQVSTEPLLPSEQFGLGGYNTVRGYEQRELNMDDAVLLSMEARSPGLPIAKWIKSSTKIVDALQFLGFVDYGWGVNIDTIPGTKKSDYLFGAGPGVRYTLDPYLTARLDWGIRLHKEVAFGDAWSMLHFSVTASF